MPHAHGGPACICHRTLGISEAQMGPLQASKGQQDSAHNLVPELWPPALKENAIVSSHPVYDTLPPIQSLREDY